jgi:phosphoribosylformylglycinamidine synthase
MADAGNVGLTLDSADIGQLFGEDQARYLVAASQTQAAALIAAGVAAGVPVARVGSFGGADVRLGASVAKLADLSALYRGAFAKAVA